MKRKKHKTDHQIKEVIVSRILHSINIAKNEKFSKTAITFLVDYSMFVNTLASSCFQGFSPEDTWLCTGIGKNASEGKWVCMGISQLLFGLRTWLKHQKTQQVF